MSKATSLRFFVSQSVVDAWVSADRVDLTGDTLSLREGGPRLRLVPASQFLQVASGGQDAERLIGKVKDQGAIAALGGEAYMSSVVFGDVAYDVEPGFLAVAPDASRADPVAAIASIRALMATGDV